MKKFFDEQVNSILHKAGIWDLPEILLFKSPFLIAAQEV